MALLMILALFLFVQIFTFLIPPLQSLDEERHLDRAYLLSKGKIFLGSQNSISGGDIDTGLSSYMRPFSDLSDDYDHKLGRAAIRHSMGIAWSGNAQFKELINTAAYFPLPYAPQALAISFGEHVGLTVDTTYHLARLFSLLATLGLLAAALLVYPTPLIVVALFLTPMSLFQLSSASLDAVTFGTCAVVGSLFLRGCDRRLSFDSWMHLALAVFAFSLASSRFNLIALTLLPAFLAGIRRSRSYWISSGIILCMTLGWIIFVAVTNKGMPTLQMSMMGIAHYYLTNPDSLVRVFLSTFGDTRVLRSYWENFIGILGGMDVPLDPYVYVLFGILLPLVAVISMGRKVGGVSNVATLALLCVALTSVVSLYLIELVTWTPFPGAMIYGVQGRYYTPTLIFLGFALFSGRQSALRAKVGISILFVEATVSVVSMVPKLIGRYWLT